MTTWMSFAATFIHQFNTFWFTTNIGKRSLIANRRLSKRFPAETTFKSYMMIFSILTVHSDVIGLFFAVGTEIFGTTRASYPKFGHVFCCIPRNLLTCLVTCLIIWLTLSKRENFTTRTLNNVIRVGEHHFSLLFTNVVKKLLTQSFSQIICLHQSAALFAFALSEISGWELGQ